MKKKLTLVAVQYDAVSGVLSIERRYVNGTGSRRNYRHGYVRLWRICEMLGSVEPTPYGWYWENQIAQGKGEEDAK